MTDKRELLEALNMLKDRIHHDIQIAAGLAVSLRTRDRCIADGVAAATPGLPPISFTTVGHMMNKWFIGELWRIWQDFDKKAKGILRKRGVKWKGDLPNHANLTLLYKLRNLLEHHGGVVDEEYCKEITRLNTSRAGHFKEQIKSLRKELNKRKTSAQIETLNQQVSIPIGELFSLAEALDEAIAGVIKQLRRGHEARIH